MEAKDLLASAMEVVTEYGLSVVGAILLLIVGRIAAGWARRVSRKAMERGKMDSTLVLFLSNVVFYLVLIVVLIAVLELFGVKATSLVAILGAAGLAVGLAMQGTLSNFAAGVMLLIFRPFRVGDWVEVGGATGLVMEIGLFATNLRSADNIMIVVPNSEVWGNTISNYNGYETRRVDMVVGVSYNDDLGLAMDTIRDVVSADERVLAEPPLQVAVSNMGDSAVDIVVRPWCQAGDYWSLRFDLLRQLKEGLEAAGCSIPYPQRDVHNYDHGQPS